MCDRKSIVTGVAICLSCALLGTPVRAASTAEGGRFTDPTRRILQENGLKKVAKKDPAEAIRALDRFAEDSVAVSIAIAEIALDAAGRRTPHQAKGFYLRAAAETYLAALDQGRGKGGMALELQDEAVEGLIRVLQEADSEALRGGAELIIGPLDSYELQWKYAGEHWSAATHDFELASALPTKKKEQGAGTRDGLGIPLVAVYKEEDEEEAEREDGLFEIYRYYYALTAVFELGAASGNGPRPAVLRLVDPRIDETYDIDGIEYPLSIDVGAEYAALTRNTDAMFAKKGILHAGKYLSLASLYLTEPLRPGKIPLVLTHGLSSSPATWAEPASAFLLDPQLRQGYQIWLFAYPTGLPFPISAMLMRRSLNEAIGRLNEQGSDPNNSRVVMIGHSMGGLLTRMQVTDTGNTLWDAIFAVPPEELDLNPEEIDWITETLIVEPLPFVERAIFCSTPHRGSQYAARRAGKLGSRLVRLPKTLAEFSKKLLFTQSEHLTSEAAEMQKISDSVQTLQPEHPLVLALDTLPIDAHVTYHTIVGDRGKGDTPNSSDGAVPYWSSHLDGAASEKVVPSGHGSHKHEEGIQELERILRLHLEESGLE